MIRTLAILGLLCLILAPAIEAGTRDTAASRVIPGAPRPEWSAEQQALIDAIGAAKRAGDSAAIARLEAQRARQLGRSVARIAQPATDIEVIFYGPDGPSAMPEDIPENGRWLPGDVRLSSFDRNEWEGELAADQDGNLYECNIFIAEGGEQYLDLYTSSDGGLNWFRFLRFLSGNPSDATLAIGDGEERYLLAAWVSFGDRLVASRINLDDLSASEGRVILVNPAGIANPRIVTDSPEFHAWYGYIVFNAMAVDNWVLLSSRTTDFGDSWEAPQMIAGYCGYPGSFYDGHDAHPDIAAGSDNVFVAFDNYPEPCSSTTRDVFVMQSEDWGVTWDSGVQLTDEDDDEFQPAVAAIKHDTMQPTAVVAYTRYYHELDDDIWYVATQDDGDTWSTPHCIECTTGWERYASLVASDQLGYIHAGYWDEGYLTYERATHSDPSTWLWQRTLTDDGTLSQWYPIDTMIDPTQDQENEFCAAWTDVRFLGSYGYDIYYNSAGLADPYAAVSETDVTPEAPALKTSYTAEGSMVLEFELPAPGLVDLAIIDVTGRHIATLCDGEVRAAGVHHVTWDGCDAAGKRAAVGVYYGRLKNEDHTVTESLVTLR